MYNKLMLIGLASFLTLMISCSQETVEVTCDGSIPTYDNEIKPIIDATCAVAGCHPDGTGHRGDYSSYSAFQDHMEDGQFEKRVLTKQNMPKGDYTLTTEELTLIKCWVENGYPEN